MSDYLDRVLTAAERVIGTASNGTAGNQNVVVNPEASPGLPQPGLLTHGDPEAVSPAWLQHEPPPEHEPPTQHPLEKAVLPSVLPMPETTAPVHQVPELRLNDDSAPATVRVEHAIAAAHVESYRESPEPPVRPVFRTPEPRQPHRPAPSWSETWLDVPEGHPPAVSNVRTNPAAPREPADARPATATESSRTLSERQPIESARPVLAPAALSAPPRPFPDNQTMAPPVTSVGATVLKTATPKPPQGLVIHNLEIRVMTPETERPAPPPPQHGQKPETPAGAWESPARRYAGRG
jgi:hypothetical protein